ncbi:MAG: class I SAM-dependent methyltransferase [Rhodanobacter sp.]
MTDIAKPRTATQNGRLWGARAEDWANIQEGQFSSAYDAVFDACCVGAGTRYCDLGCGAGMAVLAAFQRGAEVSGLDAADGLLAIARTRVPQADLRSGDLEELPFADGRFDLVTGFNSFQYAANPVVALAEARRITRPASGRVVIMTWGAPDGMEAAALVAALKPLLPPPPPGAPGPFALSDDVALRSFAESAGLRPLQITDVSCHWRYPNLETALRGLGSSGVAVRAAENSSEEALNDAHRAALAPFQASDGSFRISASFKWLLASV